MNKSKLLLKHTYRCSHCDKLILSTIDKGTFRLWSSKDDSEVKVCSPCNQNVDGYVLNSIVKKIDPDLPVM